MANIAQFVKDYKNNLARMQKFIYLPASRRYSPG
jgi:hypothetical protein